MPTDPDVIASPTRKIQPDDTLVTYAGPWVDEASRTAVVHGQILDLDHAARTLVVQWADEREPRRMDLGRGGILKRLRREGEVLPWENVRG